MSYNYNNFKQSTIRGSFRNEDYADGSVKANAYIKNDISISGQLYCNYLNTLNLNGYNFNSLINSLSGSINNNTIYNTNYFNTISSYIVYNNNVNTSQNLINNTLSSRINNYIISNNNNINTISSYIVYNNNVNTSQNLINTSLSNIIYNNYNTLNSSISDIELITNKFTYTPSSNYVNLNLGTNLSLNGNLYLSPNSYIIQGVDPIYTSTITTNLKNLPFLDISSSIQSQFNNINTLLSNTTYVTNYLKFSNNIQVRILALTESIQLVYPGNIYKYLTLDTLSYLDATSSIQTQFQNINNSINTISSYIVYNNNVNTSQNLINISLSSLIYNNNNNTSQNLINISLSSLIYSNNINSNLYSLSLSGRINNNFNNQNLINISLSSLIYSNNNNSNLYNISLSGRMNNYIISNNLINTSLSNVIYKNYNIIQNELINNYVTTLYLTTTLFNFISITALNTALGNYAKYNTNPLYLLDISGNMNAPSIYENNTLLSSKYLAINGTAVVSNRSINVAFTNDTTSTNLCVAMTAASSSTNSAALRLDTNLRYNCVTNTLSTTSFNGFLIGSCSGSSTSCSGNSETCTIASTVTVTADNTSTSLFIPLISGDTTSEIKVDQGLSYNAVTNTLSTTNGSFSGNITGSLNGTSGTSYSIYNSITTGSINLASGLTSGILTIGNSLCDAATSYIYGAIGGANYLFNNITTGSINIGLYITSGHIYFGGGSHTGIIHIGANNSRIRIQNQEFSIYSVNPVGSIIQMALNTAPTGYLLCNGASYSTTTYSALYGAIGQTYGFGTGTFNVPNFQGAFLRGGGTQTQNSRVYTSNSPGVYQADQVGSHSHTQNVSLNGVSSSVGSANVTTSINPNSGNTTENRVFNYCVYYYIKY